MRFNIDGEEWTLVADYAGKDKGGCDFENRQIQIHRMYTDNPRLRGWYRMLTILHEAEHLADPDADERTIRRRSYRVAKVLQAAGFRQTEKQNER